MQCIQPYTCNNIHLHTHFCGLNLCSQLLYLLYNNPPLYLSSSKYTLVSQSRCGLRFTNTEHSCLVHLSITPCISCLPYACEPEARPLGWLALKSKWTHQLPWQHQKWCRVSHIHIFPGHMAISLVSAGEDVTFLFHSSLAL